MKRKFDDRQGLKDLPTRPPERAISADALRNPRVAKILKILKAAEVMPRGWSSGTDAWKKRVALKHGVSSGAIYRWKNRFDENGIVGLEHHKSNTGPRVWTPAGALDFWIGQALLPANRKIDLRFLYQDVLIVEARLRGWKIGGWCSALWWLQRRAKLLMGL